MLEKRNTKIKTRYNNIDIFINKSKNVHGNTYDYSLVKEVKNIDHKLPIVCKLHGVFYQTPKKHITRKQGCPKCGNIKISTRFRNSDEKIKLELDKICPNTVTPYYNTYISTSTRMKFNCSIHGEFKQRYTHFINGHHCPKCGHERGGKINSYGLNGFIKLSKKVHGDKYDYSKAVYIHADYPITIICRKHGEFIQIPRNHYNGAKCHVCTGEETRKRCVKDIDKFIEDANRVHNNFFKYDKVVYVNNKIPVIITCPLHGDFESRPDNHLNGTGCIRCNESKGERKIAIFLEKLDISFKREYTIEGYRYKYDFYIPDIKLLIEYDGALHFIAVPFFGGQAALDKTKERDRNKNEIAKIRGLVLIRLHYRMFENLEDNFLYHLSKYYKYRYKNKFYKNFLSMVRELGLSIDNVKRSDFEPYLTVNLNKKFKDLSHSDVCQ